MSEPRLLQDIRNQPASLERVIEYQLGPGRAALSRAAEAMRGAPRIVLTGMGSSLFACEPLRYLLASRGLNCEVVDAAELAHYLHPAAKQAAVVLVSRSGDSVEIVKALSLVSRSAAVTIGVTNEPGGRLASDSSLALFVNSCADDMVAVQTYTGTLLTLLLLGSIAAGDPEQEWRPAAQSAIAALAQAVRSFEIESESWRNFLADARSVYLLGRGPSLGSAFEGALLFNEAARTCSTAMGAGGFRHGPLEIVEPGFSGIVFAPEGATRELNLALARDIAAFGGSVRVVGPATDQADYEMLWRTASVPDAFAPLVEIAPVQFAAFRLARWRGLVPGRFRYVPQVTTSELLFKQPEA